MKSTVNPMRCLHAVTMTLAFAILGLSVARDATAQNAAAEKTAVAEAGMSVRVLTDPARVEVMDGDELVAGYRVDSNGKPIVYPVFGPGGVEMTRRYPIEDALPTEKQDHPHHRSLWMTHGEVNGVDFWAEGKETGNIVQRDLKVIQPDDETAPVDSATIETINDWMTPDGKRVLSDVRRMTFFRDGDRRVIDFDITLQASDGDVHFGDTKEGSFGMRVPGTMKVDAKLGGVITNAEGQTNKQAWGQKSAWVDYSGPVTHDGESNVMGVTIHDHPSSFGYPCRWHVRTYGLFAANPFGVYHFTGGQPTEGVTMPNGETMRLRYRVVLHQGPLDPDATQEDSQRFANSN